MNLSNIYAALITIISFILYSCNTKYNDFNQIISSSIINKNPEVDNIKEVNTNPEVNNSKKEQNITVKLVEGTDPLKIKKYNWMLNKYGNYYNHGMTDDYGLFVRQHKNRKISNNKFNHTKKYSRHDVDQLILKPRNTN